MKAVVLAGGQEFGQCPLSRHLPRALWPFVDRPLIEHVLRALHAVGIGDMAISANGRTGDIARRIGRQPSPGITVHYSEDALPRGAAGCIKDCQRWLGADTFLVASGACLMSGVDLEHLVDEHRRSGAVLTIAAALGPADGLGGPALKPTGLYVCESEVLSHIRERGYQDMKEQLIPRLVHLGHKVHAVPLRGRIIPIRDEESYLNAAIDLLENPDLRDGFIGHLPAQAPAQWIDATACIHPQARLVGPVYVGPGARVMADATIIGPAMIGAECTIERQGVVHEAILWPQARVGRKAIVEQTVMARGATIADAVEVRCSIVLETVSQGAICRHLGSRTLALAGSGMFFRWWRTLREGLRPVTREAV